MELHHPPSDIKLYRLFLDSDLDDYINPKIGKSIFGCETIFDHAAKANQSQYPWVQNIVSVGLLKQVKGRWACLFLDFRFYLARKTIAAEKDNAKIKGTVVLFQSLWNRQD